jgi:hypothetical protein
MKLRNTWFSRKFNSTVFKVPPVLAMTRFSFLLIKKAGKMDFG